MLLLTDLLHTRRDSKSATSIGATAHWADRLFRLRKALTKFPPLAVVSAFSVRSMVARSPWSVLHSPFRANKLESLPLRGQPTGLTLLSFAPGLRPCVRIPQNIANRKTLPQGEGCPPIPLECPQTLAITAFLANSIVPVSSKKHLFYPSAIRQANRRR